LQSQATKKIIASRLHPASWKNKQSYSWLWAAANFQDNNVAKILRTRVKVRDFVLKGDFPVSVEDIAQASLKID